MVQRKSKGERKAETNDLIFHLHQGIYRKTNWRKTKKKYRPLLSDISSFSSSNVTTTILRLSNNISSLLSSCISLSLHVCFVILQLPDHLHVLFFYLFISVLYHTAGTLAEHYLADITQHKTNTFATNIDRFSKSNSDNSIGTREK